MILFYEEQIIKKNVKSVPTLNHMANNFYFQCSYRMISPVLDLAHSAIACPSIEAYQEGAFHVIFVCGGISAAYVLSAPP